MGRFFSGHRMIDGRRPFQCCAWHPSFSCIPAGSPSFFPFDVVADVKEGISMCLLFRCTSPIGLPKPHSGSVWYHLPWRFSCLLMVAVVAMVCVHSSVVWASPPVAFELVEDTENPLSSLELGRNLAPVAADLDGDGTPELYVGTHGKRVVVLGQAEKAGHGLSRLGSVFNHLDAVTMSYENDTPCLALADVDNDGDNDAVWFDFRSVANSLSAIYVNGMVFLRNEGTREAPDFQMVAERENPFAGISSEWQGTPVFGDFDGDGDADLLFGDRDGRFRYCRNLLVEEGVLAYAELMGALNPFFGIDVGDNSSPATLDIDGDGDLDVLSGAMRGGLRWVENTTLPGGAIAFGLKDPASDPFISLSTGVVSMPAVLDIDGDADLDVVVGNSRGHLTILVNQQFQPQGNPSVAHRVDPLSQPPARLQVKGDLNGDEVADLKDALLALKTLAEAMTGSFGARVAEGPRARDGEG
jgi:hypothetical protein